jgi:hypothetical protein
MCPDFWAHFGNMCPDFWAHVSRYLGTCAHIYMYRHLVINGFNGYPLIPWISMDSMDIMDSMEIHGIHGYAWIPWISMDSMDMHIVQTPKCLIPNSSCLTPDN